LVSQAAHVFRALVDEGRFEPALALGEWILQQEPSVTVRYALEFPWICLDQPEQKERALRRMAAQSPRARATTWLRFYRLALTGGRPDGAWARGLPPRFGWMLRRLGWLSLLNGRYEQALELLGRALDYEPTEWRARCIRAEALYSLGRLDEALSEMTAAVDQTEENDRGEALAWRGEMKLWAGDYEAALADLDEACARHAPFAFCWRGGAKMLSGRLEEALADFETALLLDELDLETWVWKGEAQRRAGRPREALKSLAMDPDNPWARVNSALALRSLGEVRAAKEHERRLPKEWVSFGLERALERARGWRRKDRYVRPLWNSPSS
jgi:tetratricopeptide (TPR) repeat protein